MPERKWFVALAIGFVVLIAVVAVFFWRPYRPAPPEQRSIAFRPVAFSNLPGWRVADTAIALQAFQRSCGVIARMHRATPMGGAGYAGTVRDWQQVCARIPPGLPHKESARTFFEMEFSPVEIRPADKSEGLFTGYYEPEILASRTAHAAYTVPIYGLPAGLVSIDLGLFRDKFEGERLQGCLRGRKVMPCPTRAEINAHGLNNAPVLFYANDPVAVFFLHIQGSGRVRLEDGSVSRVAYAGQNGRPYTAVGRTLLERGWLAREKMSMQAIRDWMRDNPREAREVMETDQSYIFFQEQPLGEASLGGRGSEGVPLTPKASLALDQRIHPLGMPVYVVTTRPDADPNRPDLSFDQLLVAQDTGGAIRGPVRGDVFWGFGREAESIAGHMKAKGRFFVLLPKPVAARLVPTAGLGVP